MNNIYVLPKWNYSKREKELQLLPYQIIDTTSDSGMYSDLSPFKLNAEKYGAKNFENLWQFSKVYKQFIEDDGTISDKWYKWSLDGFNTNRAIRYPIGKGFKPEYLLWNGKKLSYIEARKRVYIPIYAELVQKTQSFKILKQLFENNNLILLDYDAYDHQVLNITLKDVVNNPNKKCGHAFVLMMILTNVLNDCIE